MGLRHDGLEPTHGASATATSAFMLLDPHKCKCLKCLCEDLCVGVRCETHRCVRYWCRAQRQEVPAQHGYTSLCFWRHTHTSCSAGLSATPPHEWCLCVVNIKTEMGYGVVLCSTGLPMVTSMIPGDCFGCMSTRPKVELESWTTLHYNHRWSTIGLQSLQLVWWLHVSFPWTVMNLLWIYCESTVNLSRIDKSLI